MVVTNLCFPHLQSRLPNVKGPRILFDEVDDDEETEFSDFQYEVNRLDTFRNWSFSVVRPEKLAVAGFYFAGQGDTVKCFACHVQLNNWQEGDDPIAEHRRYSPQCKFIRKVICGNVSLDSYNRQSVTETHVTRDMEREYFSYSLHRAQRPEYCNYLKRLATFDTWPSTKKQVPDELAEAGFYYVGCEDHISCFYCGIALRNLEDNDIPWELHAKWMPECFYVLHIKGYDYVSSINSPEGRDVTEQTLGETNHVMSISPDEAIPFAAVSEGYDEDNEDNIRAAFRVLQFREEFLKAEAEEIERAEKEKDQEKVLEKKKNNQEEKEEESVDDTLQCKICFAKKRNILFLTCGHVVSCNTCSKMVNNVCPVCRKRIIAMIQITIV